MKNATGLERFTGSTATEACLTLIGALSGNPIAALLPVLNSSLAAARQKVRVEEALRDIESTLGTHSELLHNLSDAQYQLVNESILAVLQTKSAEKIRYLRNAVHNSLFASGIPPQEAIVLARIIRDISADEAAFVIENFRYQRVQLRTLGAGQDDAPDNTVLSVDADSPAGLVVTGLISLGLLSSPGPIFNDIGRFRFSPVVAKLLVLLREPSLEPVTPAPTRSG